MAGRKLTFATGEVDYEINGVAHVRFNPTDAAFTERLYNTFSDLDARQEEFQAEVEQIGTDGARMFAYATERDKDMRGIIDGLLGEGTADALFPNMNCYALADGLPVWINLMFAIAEEIEAAYTEEQKKGDPRVEGYNKKYQAMLAKYKTKKR